MAPLPIILLLQLIAQFHQNREQILWSMSKRKIQVGVGKSGATANVAFPLAQIAQQQTFAAAARGHKRQNREQRPGLLRVTPTQRVKKRNRLTAVSEGCQLIVRHLLLPPTLDCVKIDT